MINLLKNNKWFSLAETVLAVMIFSLLITSVFTVLTTLVENINTEALSKKVNEVKTSISSDLWRLIKDQSYEFSTYSYTDILDVNKDYIDSTVDPDGKITTEKRFRTQLRGILNSDWITLAGWKILWVLDEKSQKQNDWWTTNLDERKEDLKKLMDYWICKWTISVWWYKVCDLKNIDSEIDDSFSILIWKKAGLIHMFYVSNWFLKHKVFTSEADKVSNNIINDISVYDSTTSWNIKIRWLKFDNISQNYSYFDWDKKYSSPWLLLSVCNFEYSNNDIIVGNLYCN